MRAAVYTGMPTAGTLGATVEVRDVSEPTPGDGEVLLEIDACAVFTTRGAVARPVSGETLLQMKTTEHERYAGYLTHQRQNQAHSGQRAHSWPLPGCPPGVRAALAAPGNMHRPGKTVATRRISGNATAIRGPIDDGPFGELREGE